MSGLRWQSEVYFQISVSLEVIFNMLTIYEINQQEGKNNLKDICVCESVCVYLR